MLFQARIYHSLLLAIGSGSLASIIILTAPPARGGRLAGGPPAVSLMTLDTNVSSQILFDDFGYSNYKELAKHGWISRTVAGWPGVPRISASFSSRLGVGAMS